jgi:Flp pilus assembly protein TadD
MGEIYSEGMSRETDAADISSMHSNITEVFDAGLECMAEGNASRAAEMFEQVLALRPSDVEAAHGLIRALVDAGRVDEALARTQQLIEQEPDDVLAVTRLSMIYQQKGMIAEAEAAAARAKILGWKMELRGGPAAKTDL